MEYLKDLNATQAAIRAGYSEKTAKSVGQENLTKPDIANRISEAKAERSDRTKVSADWLLSQLFQEAVADVADLYNEATGALKPVHEWPKIWRQGLVSGVDISELNVDGQVIGQVAKVKLADRTRIKELIGKHVDVNAFKEQVEHKGLEAPQIIINRPNGD